MVGIDVSKRALTCTLVDDGTRETVWVRTFPNTLKGIRELLLRAPISTSFVLEPTGRYSTLLARTATEAGYSVYLAPTKKARDFLKSVSSRVKSDPVDSQGLARYALSCHLNPYPLKAAIVERLHQLLALRRSLSRDAAKLTLQRREMPYTEDIANEALADLRKHVRRLDAEIARHLESSELREDAARLREVPGFGPVISAALVACLAHKHFAQPGQFVAYAGLDITVRSSGAWKGKAVVSHQGDAELRRLLYLAAQANVRIKDSPFRAQYEREKDKGLPATAALCSVARKMARLSWSLVKHKARYDPNRVYRQ